MPDSVDQRQGATMYYCNHCEKPTHALFDVRGLFKHYRQLFMHDGVCAVCLQYLTEDKPKSPWRGLTAYEPVYLHRIPISYGLFGDIDFWTLKNSDMNQQIGPA